MQGPLHEIGLTEVLQFLDRGRRSGVLQVVGPDPTIPRTLRLQQGRLVGLEPDASEEAVNRALVARALAPADGTLELPASVRAAMRLELAESALAVMLNWTRGHFEFADDPAQEGPLAIRIDTILRGLVEAEEGIAELALALEEFRAVPDFPDEIDKRPGTPLAMLSPADWRILDAVDGVRSVAAIAAHLEVPLHQVAERILALRGETILVLRPGDPDVSTAARAAVESGRYDDAVEQLMHRVAVVPADEDAWRLLGLAQVGAGRFDRAIEAWQAWGRIAGPRAGEADTLIQAAQTMMEAMRAHRE